MYAHGWTGCFTALSDIQVSLCKSTSPSVNLVKSLKMIKHHNLTPGVEGTLTIKKRVMFFNSIFFLSSPWLWDPLAIGVSHYFLPPFPFEYIIKVPPPAFFFYRVSRGYYTGSIAEWFNTGEMNPESHSYSRPWARFLSLIAPVKIQLLQCAPECIKHIIILKEL